MLGVPVGFQLRIDLAVDHEHARCAFGNPGFDRIEIVKRAHRGAARAVAASNGGTFCSYIMYIISRRIFAV